MKKILCFLLSIGCFLSLISCTDSNTTDNNKISNSPKEKIGHISDYDSFETELSKRLDLSKYSLHEEMPSDTLHNYEYTFNREKVLPDNSSNFTVEIDGIELTMPLTVEALLKKGFTITEINFNPVFDLDIEENFSSGSLNIQTKNGNNFLAYAINPGENYQGKMKDCLITQIDISFYQNGHDYETDQKPFVPEVEFFQSIKKETSLDSIIKEMGYPNKINYGTAFYNGKTTISSIQLLYNFSNNSYDGYVYFTIEPMSFSNGEVKNMIQHIAYAIEFD